MSRDEVYRLQAHLYAQGQVTRFGRAVGKTSIQNSVLEQHLAAGEHVAVAFPDMLIEAQYAGTDDREGLDERLRELRDEEDR